MESKKPGRTIASLKELVSRESAVSESIAVREPIPSLGVDLVIIKNPSRAQFFDMMKMSKYKELRMIGDGQDLYVWDSDLAVHSDVTKKLGLSYNNDHNFYYKTSEIFGDTLDAYNDRGVESLKKNPQIGRIFKGQLPRLRNIGTLDISESSIVRVPMEISDLTVLKNPTSQQFRNLVAATKYGQVRILIGDGDLYAWDAALAIHAQVYNSLGPFDIVYRLEYCDFSNGAYLKVYDGKRAPEALAEPHLLRVFRDGLPRVKVVESVIDARDKFGKKKDGGDFGKKLADAAARGFASQAEAESLVTAYSKRMRDTVCNDPVFTVLGIDPKEFRDDITKIEMLALSIPLAFTRRRRTEFYDKPDTWSPAEKAAVSSVLANGEEMLQKIDSAVSDANEFVNDVISKLKPPVPRYVWEELKTWDIEHAREKIADVLARPSDWSDALKMRGPVAESVVINEPVDSFMDKKSKLVVLKNPSSQQFDNLASNSMEGTLRLILDVEGDLYAWDAFYAYHDVIAGRLGLDRDPSSYAYYVKAGVYKCSVNKETLLTGFTGNKKEVERIKNHPRVIRAVGRDAGSSFPLAESVETVNIGHVPVKVYKNLSRDQFLAIVKNSDYNSVRFMTDGPDIYAWDADDAIHLQVASAMGLDYGTIGRFYYDGDTGQVMSHGIRGAETIVKHPRAVRLLGKNMKVILI